MFQIIHKKLIYNTIIPTGNSFSLFYFNKCDKQKFIINLKKKKFCLSLFVKQKKLNE